MAVGIVLSYFSMGCLLRAIPNYFCFFQRDQCPAAGYFQHLICDSQEVFNFFGAVHDFYDNGQVMGQVEQFGAVDTAAGAIGQESAQDGRTGYALLFCRENKGFIQGLLVPFVEFADEDAE